MPGIQKILVLAFVGWFHSSKELGAFVNDTFIIQILSYFTAFNWANILMVDIHRFDTKFQPSFFGRILKYSAMYQLPIVLVALALYKYDWIQNINGVVIYLLTFSIYQLWRHYALSFHRYYEILVWDSLILILSFALSWATVGNEGQLLSMLALPFALPLVYFVIKEKFMGFPLELKIEVRKLHTRAIQNAFSNFSTASMGLFIAPISYKLLSAEYTAVIGFFSNIGNVLLLLPRAISLNKLPALAKSYHAKGSILEEFKRYEINIFKVLVLLLFLATFSIFLIAKTLGFEVFGLTGDLPYLYHICGLILVATLASQLALPISNLVMIERKEGVLLKVNLIALCVFIASFIIGYFTIESRVYLIIFYQCMLIFQHVGRFGALCKSVFR